MALLKYLSDVAVAWTHSKTAIETFVNHSLGFSHDALHVFVGPSIQLLGAALMRTSVRSFRPWLVVLLLELLNEWHDLYVEQWPSPAMQWGEGTKDLLLTMALPTLLLIVTRCAPGLFVGSERAGGSTEAGFHEPKRD